ncbi:MAG: PaaI family thioesterase [Phycisphaerales bacterium]
MTQIPNPSHREPPGGGSAGPPSMEQDEAAASLAMPAGRGTPAVALSVMDKLEAYIARLSARSTFWHRVCSLIWLPYAFRSGIRMKKVDSNTFAAELPFRRFNRNWYNAMAGAALLANSEIAGGMYIFGITGGDYTLVCKELSYKFLRPCFGPALYKITPREDIRLLIATGKEFNITVDLEVIQQAVLPAALAKRSKKDSVLARLASKERRVGKCTATFHVTPTIHQKEKRGSVRNVGA